MRVSRARLLLVLAVACYVAVFNATYRDLVVPVFEFWGLGYASVGAFDFWTSVVLCIVPALWMPLAFSRPSLLLFYIQYLLIFVPACFIVYHSVRPHLSPEDSRALVLVMFAGLSIVEAAYFFAPKRILATRVSAEAFWIGFALVAASLFLYLAVTLGRTFQLVGFSDVYNLRSTMVETVKATGSSFGVYAQTLLAAVVLPLLFATGVARRAWWLTIIVAFGYAFLFGIGGAKASALAILYLPLAALLFSRTPQRIPLYFLYGLSAVLLMGYVTRQLLSAPDNLRFEAVVHFRFFTVPPLTIPQYFDFFSSHPVTHLSHVTGFNRLLHYPYTLDVPTTIGTYFYGGPVGANSGFWAGDGIAGFGIYGILLLSILCGTFFWIFDSTCAELQPRYVALAIAFSSVFFQNVSFFTTLVTGGLAFLTLAMLVAPRDAQGYIVTPTFWQLRQ